MASPSPLNGFKVTYLITRADTIGGAQVHVLQLSQALKDAGGRPHILIGAGNTLLPRLQEAQVPFTSIPVLQQQISPLNEGRALLAIRRALAADPPDLLSCHSSKTGILGRLAGRSLRIPTLFTAHGWSFAEGVPARSRIAYREIERLLSPLAARIITVSEADRQLAIRTKVASARRVLTVHNGAPDVDENLRANPAGSDCNILCVARLEQQKRVNVLLRALAEINDDTWRLTIVGDGPLRTSLSQLAQELHISERVEFAGFRNDIPELMSRHQMLVLPSDWEGFPRIILEAMRSGLPVIASDVGGVREAVHDGETGLVVPHNTVGRWLHATQQLVGDPPLRAQMGKAARMRYEDQFTLARMVEQTFGVYASLATDDQTP